MAASAGGLDLLVFTGGMGEHSARAPRGGRRRTVPPRRRGRHHGRGRGRHRCDPGRRAGPHGRGGGRRGPGGRAGDGSGAGRLRGRPPVTTMRAWVVSGRPGGPGRLEQVERPVPEPGPGEVLVRVLACGVCRTDLHLADGELPPRRAAASSRATRWSARSSALGAGVRRGSPSATASASPGCGTPAGRATPAAAGARTSAATRRSPAGTPTAATPSTPWCPRPSPTGCPTAFDDAAGGAAAVLRDHRLPRAAARGSCRPAAGWASTGSAPAPT